MRFSDLTNQTKTIDVHKGDNTFKITYLIDFYTGEIEAKLKGVEESETPLEDSAEILCVVLAGWDLTEDDDVTMKPITKENLIKGGLILCTSILTAIIEDVTPNAPTSSN